MAGGGGRGGGRGGKGGGHASNAALQSDEDLMNRRRVLFNGWKAKKKPRQLIDYKNSPSPPRKK